MTSEEWKSIEYRIENDAELHAQLSIISNIRDSLSLDGVRDECINGPGKTDPNCIDNYRKNEIKNMISKDSFYQKQCDL